MIEPRNPFLIYGYHSPAYFCDREAETQKLISALRNGRNVTLIDEIELYELAVGARFFVYDSSIKENIAHIP